MKKVSINEFLENFEAQASNFYGFTDWWCRDSALKNRAKQLLPKLRFLVKNGIVDGETMTVEFKNSLPLNGDVYDEIRFYSLAGGSYLGGFIPKFGYRGDRYGSSMIWTMKNGKVYSRKYFLDWNEFKKVYNQA